MPSHVDSLRCCRNAHPDDLADIVRVHQSAFPGFFLTRLGPGVLQVYYRQVLEVEGSIFLVEVVDGQIVGFVAGFVDPARFYRQIRAGIRDMIIPALLGILSAPSIIPRMLVNLLRIKRKDLAQLPYPGLAAELASIGVMPEVSGQGVGRQLVARFLAEATVLGAAYVTLTTDADNNDRTNLFYRKLGFQVAQTLTQADGRTVNAYVYSLIPPEE